MKLLLLLFIIGCGHDKIPSADDIQDIDGDGILNYLENDGVSKYVAKTETIKKISGVLRIKNGRFPEIPFSNELDFRKEIMKLLVGHYTRKDFGKNMLDGSVLRLHEPPIEILENNQYSVSLHFDSGSFRPQSIALDKKGEIIHLGRWEPVVNYNISKNNLDALLKGEANLIILDNTAPTKVDIKKATYKIYFSDENESRVFYVSNLFPLSQFLNHFDVLSPSKIELDSIFYKSHHEGVAQWWIRELEDGNWVVAKATQSELTNNLHHRFNISNHAVSRENGSPAKKLELNKDQKSQFFLKLRATKTHRRFKESVQSERHTRGYGGGGRDGNASRETWTCNNFFRSIAEEINQVVTVEDFLTSTRITLDGHPISLQEGVDFDIYQEQDQKGLFWNLELKIPFSSIKIETLNSPTSSFVLNGFYRRDCADNVRPNPVNTNTEGHLRFEIEAYVEKVGIQD